MDTKNSNITTTTKDHVGVSQQKLDEINKQVLAQINADIERMRVEQAEETHHVNIFADYYRFLHGLPQSFEK